MVKRKQTHEILDLVILAMNKTFTGTSIVDNTDGTYTIEACNTLWITRGESLTIGVNNYTVTDIVPNVSILLTGSVLPTTSTFDILLPKFYYGTMMFVNEELRQIRDHLPMIYLHQVYKERFNDDPDQNVSMTSSVNIYAMTLADFTNFTIIDHNKYCVLPMRNAIFSFLDSLQNFSDVETLLYEYTITDLIKWGSYFDPKGNQKQYFQDDVSGCGLEIDIPFSKKCCECC